MNCILIFHKYHTYKLIRSGYIRQDTFPRRSTSVVITASISSAPSAKITSALPFRSAIVGRAQQSSTQTSNRNAEAIKEHQILAKYELKFINKFNFNLSFSIHGVLSLRKKSFLSCLDRKKHQSDERNKLNVV